MEGANVFYIENSRRIAPTIRGALREAGHFMVFGATTPESAISQVEEARKWGIDVVVLDPAFWYGLDGGGMIATVFRRELPGVPIISFAPWLGKQTWADVSLLNNDSGALVRTIGEMKRG